MPSHKKTLPQGEVIFFHLSLQKTEGSKFHVPKKHVFFTINQAGKRREKLFFLLSLFPETKLSVVTTDKQGTLSLAHCTWDWDVLAFFLFLEGAVNFNVLLSMPAMSLARVLSDLYG